MFRKILKWLAVILLCLLPLGYIQQRTITSKNSSPPLKIAMSVWAGFAHAYVAEKKGFFKKNNVAVELMVKPKLSEVLDLFKNGDIDGGFDVFADAIVLQSQGHLLKVVYVTDYSNSGDVIIGRPEFKDLSSLRGKKISFIGFNTFSHIFVLKAMEQAHLAEYEVQFEIVPEQEVLSALEEGRIQAGHTWEPTVSQALKKGYRVLAKAGDIPGIITSVLFFKKDIVEERPEDIKAIVKSLLEAQQYCLYNTGECIEIMSESMGMTEEEMRQGLQGLKQLDIIDNSLAMKPSQEPYGLYSSGNFISKFLIQTGQLNRFLDFNDMINPDFIHALIKEKKPEPL